MSDAGHLSVGAVAERLGLSICATSDGLQTRVTGAQVSDLLSYVMSVGRRGDLWITIQIHPNIVAVAELAGLAGIIIAGGFEPEEETIMRAEEEGIPLLTCRRSSFAVAGELYQLGLR